MEIREFVRDESALEMQAKRISEGARKLGVRVKKEVFDKEYREEVYRFGVLSAFAYFCLM